MDGFAVNLFAFLICWFNVILVFALTDAYGAIIVAVVVIGSLMLALSFQISYITYEYILDKIPVTANKYNIEEIKKKCLQCLHVILKCSYKSDKPQSKVNVFG